mgnify:CR=1 FL=1
MTFFDTDLLLTTSQGPQSVLRALPGWDLPSAMKVKLCKAFEGRNQSLGDLAVTITDNSDNRVVPKREW